MMLLGVETGHWLSVRDGDPRLVSLYERHYSCNPLGSHAARLRSGVSGVGESMVLLTVTCDAGWIWIHNTTARYDGQVGVQCSFFRNEGTLRSSDLIREADALADTRWPGLRHWTYVDAGKTRHKRDPGRCYLRAGWQRCGESQRGLVILERLPLSHDTGGSP